MPIDDELFSAMGGAPAQSTQEDLIADSMASSQQSKGRDDNLIPPMAWLQDYANPKFLKPTADAMHDFFTNKTPIAATAGGIVQSGADISKSIANVPLEALSKLFNKDLTMEREDLSQYVNPEWQTGFDVGKLGGDIGINAALFGGLPSSGIQGWGRVGEESVKGGLLGAATNQFGYGGREAGGLVGAIAPYVIGSLSSVLGKNIQKAGASAMDEYGGRIGQTLENTSRVSRPWNNQAINDIMTGNSGNHKLANVDQAQEALSAFFASPTAQKAQDALSVIKRLRRETMRGVPKGNIDLLPDAGRAKVFTLDAAIDSLDRSLKGSMTPQQWEAYAQSLQEYAVNAAPYSNLLSQDLPPSALPKSIRGLQGGQTPDREAADLFFKQHPELYLNKFMPGIGIAGGVASGAAAGGSALKDFISELLGNNNEGRSE